MIEVSETDILAINYAMTVLNNVRRGVPVPWSSSKLQGSVDYLRLLRTRIKKDIRTLHCSRHVEQLPDYR